MAAAAVRALAVLLIAVGATAASSRRPAVLPADCGRRLVTPDDVNRPYIVGDGNTTAYYGQYPWQAHIKMYSRKSSSYVHHCGGIIITRRHVLTAAHCVYDVAPSALTVSVGDHRLDRKESAEQEFAVSNYYVHVQYGSGTSLANDIALLRLKVRQEPGIVFGRDVQPACLPDEGVELEVNTPCEVSGWGKTADNAPLSDVLRGVTVPLVSDQFCSASEVYEIPFIPTRTLCAGKVRGGPDACRGDSGGPLVCPNPSDGHFIAYGIVSSGDPIGCGQLPGLYTKVSGYLDWLMSRLRLDDTQEIGDDPIADSIPECGLSDFKMTANVRDGKVDRGEFPWLASIARSGHGSFSCPATLLSDRWIVTGWECARHLSRGQPPFRVALHTEVDAGPVLLNIVRLVSHPKYSDQFRAYDIALLQTASPIPLSARLRPICLADEQLSELTSGDIIITAAWKSTGNYSTSPAPVRWTELEVYDPDKWPGVSTPFGSHIFRSKKDALYGIFLEEWSDFRYVQCRTDISAPLMTSSVKNGMRRWFLVSPITSSKGCHGSSESEQIIGVKQATAWIRSVIAK